ncbi:MAG: YwbE family protein [Sulfurimonas sp.]|nr:YwbE family protein [Sulfurimonas sp.]MDD3059590.1 YwbE family protein [Sulfurimonas sp.]MDD5202752.1 YwbE family protein [Sulfurimonas sp.]
MSSGTERKNIRSGVSVAIVLKEDQESGKLTDGIVRDILTNSATHPHGIKVRLMSREVGRVKKIY